MRGFVERVDRAEVRGWAYDAADPGRPPLIEVAVQGRSVAVGRADQPRADLAQLGIGRDTCGFAIALPAGVGVDFAALEVRVAGGGALPFGDRAGVYEGVVELLEGGALKGWAWHCGFPAESVRLVLNHRGNIIGSGVADRLRPDLAEAGVGGGRHGFLIPIPAAGEIDPAAVRVAFEATAEPLADLRPETRVARPEVVAFSAARPRDVVVPRAPVALRTPTVRAPMARSPAPRPAVRVVEARAPSPPVAPSPVAAVESAPPPPPVVSKVETPPPPNLSPDVYEALRGALDLNEEDGLF